MIEIIIIFNVENSRTQTLIVSPAHEIRHVYIYKNNRWTSFFGLCYSFYIFLCLLESHYGEEVTSPN